MRGSSWIWLAALLLATPDAGADPPPAASARESTVGSTGEAWDDSHMRTRFRTFVSTPIPAAEVRGEDRYGQIANSSGEEPRLEVPETLSFSNQHPWRRGIPGSQRSPQHRLHRKTLTVRPTRLGPVTVLAAEHACTRVRSNRPHRGRARGDLEFPAG